MMYPFFTFAEGITPPMIVNCPSLIERQVELGVPGLIITWIEPSATDISGSAMLVDRTHAPNDFFPAEITQVIYTFRDSSLNEAVCAFMISITTGKCSSLVYFQISFTYSK